MKYFPENLAGIQASIDETTHVYFGPVVINKRASTLYEQLPEAIRCHTFVNEKGQLYYLPPSDGVKPVDRISYEAVADLMQLAEFKHPHLFVVALTRDYLLPAILGRTEVNLNLGNLPYIYVSLRPVFLRLSWAIYLSADSVQEKMASFIGTFKIFFNKLGLAL